LNAHLRAIGAAMTLAALTLGSAEAADANAVWLVNEGQARIKVEPCSSNLCATIVWLAEDPDTGKAKLDKKNPDGSLRSRPIVGLRMLEARLEREGQWRGTIYNGQTYDVTIRTEGAALKVKGCVLGGLFCSTQTVDAL
jgi:uncharacterized protein (DUF2147 family)